MTISLFPNAQDREPWSSVLFGMVNSLKPVKQPSSSSSSRLRSTRPTNDLQPHTSTSPSSHNGDSIDATSFDASDRLPKRRKINATTSSHHDRPSRTSKTRHTSPRPPSKLTRSQPDGELFQITNGVRTRIDAGEDDIERRPKVAANAQEIIPKPDQKKEDKRTLRSHDEGSRLKSELSIYFPNYEDVINDVEEEPELLNADTVIHIVDRPHQQTTKQTVATSPPKAQKSRRNASLTNPPTFITSESNPNKFNGFQLVDFSSIEKSVPHHPEDPLTESLYFKAHRRAERKEKQLRNIEKERAMHEKVQLERILDGLQGHDWLRVLGVTGVTESEARRFEPKRSYFIAEVKALVDKFKDWKEEEKRLKMEKEAALLAKEDEAEEEDAEAGAEADEDDEVADSEGEPDSSELDASAAQQLQMEAKANRKRQKQHPPQPVIYRPPSPVGPFISFYDKPHLRATALGKQRHGRNATAFGQPVPEPDEREFALPLEYTTPDALKESARRRRRMKRESLTNSKVRRG